MSQLICSNCGTVGTPKTVIKGSVLIEIVLWVCFIVPGIIYSIWRLTTRAKVCRSCGAKNMVPLNTPMGKKLSVDIAKASSSPTKSEAGAGSDTRKCPFCAEFIKAEAVICRFCQKELPPLPEAVPDSKVTKAVPMEMLTSEEQAQVMEKFGITYDGEEFHSLNYRYEKLSDAVNYAKSQATKRNNKNA